MEKMRGLVLTETGLKQVSVPKPQPKPGEVLVKLEFASVCGSDYPFLAGSKPAAQLLGSIFGHEGGGEVVALGEGVKGLRLGDKVGIESHRARPEWLADGRDPYEDPLCAIIGHRAFPDGGVPQGVYAEFIAVPEIYANRIPNELFRVYPGSLWEPLGNSIRLASVIKSKFPKPGDAVMVSGCGPQGIMIMLILKHYLGLNPIHATDVNEERLEMVEGLLGLETHLPEELPNFSPKLWLEMSGSAQAFQQALAQVPPGGTIILFGLPSKPGLEINGMDYSEFVLESKTAVINGRHLVGVCGRLREDWERAPEIIGRLSKEIRLDALYTKLGRLWVLPQLVSKGVIPPREKGLLKAVFEL